MNGTLEQWNKRFLTPENVFAAIALLGAIGAATGSRKLLESGWRATTGTEPPISPDTEQATWVESLTWGLVTGAIIGIVRVLSRHGAASMQRWWR